jgi:hypothetical protein
LVGSKSFAAPCFRVKPRTDPSFEKSTICQTKKEIFKPAIDTRYDEEMVVSHDANEIVLRPFPSSYYCYFGARLAM